MNKDNPSPQSAQTPREGTKSGVNGIIFGLALVILMFGAGLLATSEPRIGLEVVAGGTVALGYSLSPEFLSQNVIKGKTNLRWISMAVVALGCGIGLLSLTF